MPRRGERTAQPGVGEGGPVALLLSVATGKSHHLSGPQISSAESGVGLMLPEALDPQM